MNILPNSGALGAQVLSLDLSQALGEEEFAQIENALGEHSVLCFPAQQLTSSNLKRLAEQFGKLEINVANMYQYPEHAEVMILSNKVDKEGKALGLKDAGQDWHTDMSYSKDIAFANVLYALEIPYRDGKPLGNTAFCSTKRVYKSIPEDLKNKSSNFAPLKRALMS